MSGAFTAAGSPVPARVSFNSGTIDFGSNRLVDVTSLKIDLKWNGNPLYVLNSIKIAFLARSQESVSITGTINSWSPEMDNLLYGSSTTGSPQEIDTLDGQPTLINPVITCFDSNGKEFQYQVLNALFTAETVSLKQEDYTSWDFTITATDIKLVYTA
jgi:hypothetical protein